MVYHCIYINHPQLFLNKWCKLTETYFESPFIKLEYACVISQAPRRIKHGRICHPQSELSLLFLFPFLRTYHGIPPEEREAEE